VAETQAAIALGSNVGDREAYLREALRRLTPHIHDLAVSRFFDTTPVDMAAGQPRVLNAAATFTTALTAHELLERMLAIERELGRTRPHAGASRTVDLDLILFGDSIVDEPPTLVVPHPRFRERTFVLEPLAEVAADWRDPTTGLTVADLLRRLTS